MRTGKGKNYILLLLRKSESVLPFFFNLEIQGEKGVKREFYIFGPNASSTKIQKEHKSLLKIT